MKIITKLFKWLKGLDGFIVSKTDNINITSYRGDWSRTTSKPDKSSRPLPAPKNRAK